LQQNSSVPLNTLEERDAAQEVSPSKDEFPLSAGTFVPRSRLSVKAITAILHTYVVITWAGAGLPDGDCGPAEMALAPLNREHNQVWIVYRQCIVNEQRPEGFQ
jgi:hypothetical protein